MIDPEGTQPRKRGGQLGNHDAVRHGFYAAKRRGESAKPGEADPANSLVEEIAMMRHILEEISDRMAEARTLDDDLNLLNSVTITAGGG